EERAHIAFGFADEAEGRNGGDKIGLVLAQHRQQRWETAFDDVSVALVVEMVFAQHGADADIEAAADRVRGKDFSLEVFDGFDRAVFQHEVEAGEPAFDTVLILVADDAQIAQMRVLDRRGHGGGREGRDVEIAAGEGGDLGRRASEMHRLHRVALAEMLREFGLGEDNRRHRGRRIAPAGAYFYGIGIRSGGDQSKSRSGNQESYDTHHYSPCLG